MTRSWELLSLQGLKFSIVYCIVYSIVHSIEYSIVYNIVYNILYNIEYNIVYNIVNSIVYNIVNSRVNSFVQQIDKLWTAGTTQGEIQFWDGQIEEKCRSWAAPLQLKICAGVILFPKWFSKYFWSIIFIIYTKLDFFPWFDGWWWIHDNELDTV